MTQSKEPLARCPCGETPKKLDIVSNGQGGKYAIAVPECCSDWMIEFRTNYKEFDSDECQALAVAAWNGAPRARAGLGDENYDIAYELGYQAAKDKYLSKNET